MAEYETIRTTAAGARSAEIDQGLRAHMNKVYGTMSVGMLITAGAAWAISGLATTTETSQAVAQLPNGEYLNALGAAIYTSPLRWVIMLLPLAFIFFGWGQLLRKASAGMVQLGFFAFAAAIGLSLSSIFLVFTPYSIAQTFLVTAIAFAGLSLWGYTTKKDLSGMGTFLLMGLIGLIVAMIINIFLASPAMMFAISIIGILIFAGLTAFHTQEIKSTYVAHAQHGDQEWLDKAAYDGALALYISFLNMFQFLLMFMGQEQ
ncbi:BAX inhibitor (BI)-1/YccA family protein [Rhodosalinus sediminis]|jgi:FtsH-binding integral membrane protein|uniref:BAX inhibitor (BI)-1/YccA family protein n=1 Tax=Rhodosalinus sediminis TaxID=1940533 RepID=A0A3D9BSL2_9RHOB|nr:Bax inhibitor-1/YccA family protein [Rhodosalinus sediminis]REC56510.1 BAX inhibitor (BI)-1/YccA family protein [Rhodosalinus sediminis]